MSVKTKPKGISIYTSRPWELGKTIYLVVTWIVLGSHLELVGPTLNILMIQTGVSVSVISTILIARGAGYMSGNLGGALIEKLAKKYPEVLLSLAFLIASIVVFATPAITNLYVLSILFFFQGISQGLTDLAGTSLMLTMWSDNVGAPLNVVHLGYGFGAVFANLFVKEFVGEENKSIFSSDSSIDIIKEETSTIKTPYRIISILCLLICIGHLIYSIIEYKNRGKIVRNVQVNYSSVSTKVVEEKNEIEIKLISQYSPRSCGNGYFTYGLSMSILWIFYMFFLGGNDQTFGKFFFAFLRTPKFSISTKGATWAMIIYWLSYSVGRLICAIVTIFVPVHIALSGLWICGLILAIGWYIFVWIIGLTSTNLLVLGAFTGLIFSPTFPLSFGFINQRLKTNPLLVGLLLCGSALGAMLFQKIGGIVLERDDRHFPTLLIICVILSILFFVAASLISSIHQRKLNSIANSNIILDNRQLSNTSEEEKQMEIYLTNTEHEN